MAGIEYEPAFLPGDTLTCVAAAAITGGQLVTVTGTMTVAPTTATTSGLCGVAADTVAAGQQVAVYFHGVHGLTATSAIVAGAPVIAAGAGQVAPYTSGGDASQIIGRTLGPATANQTVNVRLP